MMDNNRGDRTINSSSFTPIDVIDLTNESPIRTVQLYKRRSENMITNDNNVSLDISHTSANEQSVSHSSKTQSLPISATTKKELNNVTKCTEDITILDDTICISDDDKHYVTESDNGEPLLLTCPICFELLCSKLKPITTRCGHIFCMQCLETHLLVSKKCPTCQNSVTLKSCTRLFL